MIVQLFDIRERSHDILNVHRVEALDVEIAVMLLDTDDAMHIVRVLIPAERLKHLADSARNHFDLCTGPKKMGVLY